MSRLAPLASSLLLLAARAAACPLCADSAAKTSAGTSVWWAVGAFLLVPPILGAVVIGAIRREITPKGP
ncbi:MAG TPA: hypothetical protein VKF32_06910 [Thermoanaerobaculia bacterium]|nr:hypothetical protein [Thermoanaerobaculia bacterium]